MFHLSMCNGLAPSSATLSASVPVQFVQMTPEANFPRLISPTFRAVITFKQQLEAWKQAHPSTTMPDVLHLIDGRILIFAQAAFRSISTADNIFDRLFELTRPKYTSDRVSLLEEVSFCGSLNDPFSLSFALNEHKDRFLIIADALKLPTSLILRRFPRSLSGPFGSIVDKELSGHIFTQHPGRAGLPRRLRDQARRHVHQLQEVGLSHERQGQEPIDG